MALHFITTEKKWTMPIQNRNKRLTSVWVADSKNVFIAGADGFIIHYNKMKWTRQTSGTDTWLRRVWGIDTNNIFAIGDNGTILYYDGTKWIRQEKLPVTGHMGK